MTVQATPVLRPRRAVRARPMGTFFRSMLPLVVLMLFAGSVVVMSWLALFLCGLGWDCLFGAA
jgi:hypothetical protein